MNRQIVIVALAVVLSVLAAIVYFALPDGGRPSSSAKRPLAVADPLRAERRGTRLAVAAAEHAQPRRNDPASPGATEAPSPPTTRPAATVAGVPSVEGWAHGAAEEYRRRAQYPPWSTPLDEKGEDPIVIDREVSANVSHGPDGNEPALVSFPDQVSFESPDPIVLFAFLSVDGTPVAAARIEAEIKDRQGAVVTDLPFNDEGRDGDPRTGDHVYAATVDPQSIATRLNGAYVVVVHAVTPTGEERFGTTGFLYSRPDAQLTGRYTDQLVDGNLQIASELQVSAAGRFYLAASLYTQDGRPLAWTQNALELDGGTHIIPLTFFGRILRQKGADGPYVLRFVALSTTTTMPNAKNRLVENAYVTQPYAASAFSDQPFNDPNLLDTANRLEQSRLHRGQAP